MNQVIVGLWGPAGVGKDSIARELRWPTSSFAAALKEECRPKFEALGLDINKREDKEKGRHILVETGAGRRKKDPNHWVRKIDRKPGHERYCITDVRYLNEILFVLFQGGVVFEVRRVGFEPANAEEARSFAEIRKACDDLGVGIAQLWNHEGERGPLIAAQDILHYLRKRSVKIAEALSYR